MGTLRRKLVFALAAAALGCSCPAVGQPRHSMPTVGIVSPQTADRVAPFREALRKLGYIEGRNIRFEMRLVGDYAQIPDAANELVRLKVDVIFALGGTSAIAASKATSTLPVVFLGGIDPVQEKLVASLSRPGGNVTGVTSLLQELSPKRVDLAREVVPGLTRIGLLTDPTSYTSGSQRREAQEAARSLNLRLHIVEARSPEEFDKAFEALARAQVKVFIMMTSGMFGNHRPQLLEAAAKHRLVGLFSEEQYVNAGGVFSYGPRAGQGFPVAAEYVDRILKGAQQ